MHLTVPGSALSATAMPRIASGTRLSSIDMFRGLIMVWMVLDHTRDFFTNIAFEPETLAQTNLALFATRWITHFCAPMFFFLAGTSAFLYGQRKPLPDFATLSLDTGTLAHSPGIHGNWHRLDVQVSLGLLWCDLGSGLIDADSVTCCGHANALDRNHFDRDDGWS